MTTTTPVTLTYPFDSLLSYHYFRNYDIAEIAAGGRIRLIGDSGAFSAWSMGAVITVDEYAGWCAQWWDQLCWAASLDVIGDPVASQRNWLRLRDQHGLLTVPTVHAGTDPSWLDFYASHGVDLIGLGGMAGTGQAVRALRWTVHMFRYARDRWPALRFHLWGVNRWDFLTSLPAWSADSSGIFGQTYRYGRLQLFDPAAGQRLGQVLLRGGRQTHRIGRLLRHTYGVDPADITTSHAGNRARLIRLTAASIQCESRWLAQRHRVAAPAMFRSATPATGPLIHAADSDEKTFGYLAGIPRPQPIRRQTT